MKKMINLTPHAINFVTEEGTPLLTVEPSGTIARVSCKTMVIGKEDGIPITTNVYGEVEGLPDPEDDTILIVSALVAGRVPHRTDVYIPNEAVRDDKGRIIGCKSLGQI